MQKVRMLKTKYPEGIPNGTIGNIHPTDDIRKPGLSMATFGEWRVFVYPHEVELVKEEP